MKMKDAIKLLYQHHFVRYLLVGGTTFIIDFGILFCLHGILKLNLAASTSVSYWVSILYNFTLNRYWTFDVREKESLKRHISTYFVLLVFNYLFTLATVSILSTHINYVIAKAIAVAVSMSWTYIVYRDHIFVNKDIKKEQQSTI